MSHWDRDAYLRQYYENTAAGIAKAMDDAVMRATTATAATVPRVGNPKRVLTADDEQAIRDAMRTEQAAKDGVRDAVLTAARHGASVRVLAEFTGKSTSTISGWKREARNHE